METDSSSGLRAATLYSRPAACSFLKNLATFVPIAGSLNFSGG